MNHTNKACHLCRHMAEFEDTHYCSYYPKWVKVPPVLIYRHFCSFHAWNDKIEYKIKLASMQLEIERIDRRHNRWMDAYFGPIKPMNLLKIDGETT